MDFRHYLDVLFNPKSIAVVGASEKDGSLGKTMWTQITTGRIPAELFPVNPKYKKLDDRKCFPSLTAIKEPIDLVVIVCPPEHYVKILTAALEKKVKAVLLCGGFPKTELSEEFYQKLEECKKAGIYIVGPQSLGYLYPPGGLNISFLPMMPAAGNIGLISQSPGLVTTIINIASSSRGGFSYVIDPGLEYSLTTADYIDLLAQDNQTQCIVLYVENFKDPRRMLSAIRLAAKNKPVILLKGGKSSFSGDIVINNNGRPQDHNDVIEKALKRSGALLLDSIYDLSYAIQTFSLKKAFFEGELYSIVNSKGLDTLVADEMARYCLTPAVIPPLAAEVLSSKFKVLYPFANPINVGMDASPKTISQILEFSLNQENCSGVLLAFVSNPLVAPVEIAKAIAPIIQQSQKPVITAWLGAHEIEPAIKFLLNNGVLALDGVRNACLSVSLTEKFFNFRKKQSTLSVPPQSLSDRAFAGARKIIQQAKKEDRNLLYDEEAKRLLASIGFETTAAMYAGSLGETIEASKALGFPVALKIRTDGILSKSDIGGVVLGIRNEKELRNAYKVIKEKAEEHHISEEDFAVTIQKTLSDYNAREFKIGMRNTKQFGPIVYLGIGGLYGDLGFKEEFNFAPISKADALEILNSASINKLLSEYKGLPPVDKEILCTCLLRLSQAAVSIPALKSIEIDPLLVGSDTAIVLDAHAAIWDKPVRPSANAEHLAFPTVLSKPAKKISGEFGDLLIRQAQPSDIEAFTNYIQDLSEGSMRLRFHGISMGAEEIASRALTNDPDRSFTVILTEPQKNRGAIVAEATFSLLPNGKSAEFGISVADNYQRKGLSQFLMTALEEEALSRGLTELVGYVLKDNGGMSKMMKKRGYKQTEDESDPHVNLFSLDLMNAADG